MAFTGMLNDEIWIVTSEGKEIGPIQTRIEENKAIVLDEKMVIEEGWKVLRPLPNGKCESHTIQQVAFKRSARGTGHFEVTMSSDSSLVERPTSSQTINITNSQGFQIGDGNTQNIVMAFEQLVKSIESADTDEETKKEAKGRLKSFLKHPLVTTLIGAAAGGVLAMLG